MPARPTLIEVEAAARILSEAGLRHRWWGARHQTSHDKRAATDPIERVRCDHCSHVDRSERGPLVIGLTDFSRRTRWQRRIGRAFSGAVPIQTPARIISDKHIRDIVCARRCHGETRLADLGWYYG
jgi:hypothetical protein